MLDAEALLLVDDDQPEVGERDVVAQQAVRPDDDAGLPGGQARENGPLLVGRREARQRVDAHRERGEARREDVGVLLGEQRGRGDQRDLPAVRDRLEGRAHRDFGLAVPDVPAEQPVHRPRPLHRRADLLATRTLIGRRVERERGGELPVPLVVRGEGKPCGGLALGGQPQQFGGHLADLLFRAPFRSAPGAPAYRVQASLRSTSPRVIAPDQVDAFDRHEQPPATRVFQTQEVLVVRALHAGKAPDPVLEVNDVVSGGEFVERGDERPDPAHGRGARAADAGRRVRPTSARGSPRSGRGNRRSGVRWTSASRPG